MKNQSGRFSSSDDWDRLTKTGQAECSELVADVGLVLDRWKVKSCMLCSADSKRALSTSDAISKAFNLPINEFQGLTSIGSGILSGRDEKWARENYPEYMNQLELYRAGLVSSYDLPRPEGAERLQDFEARIEDILTQILSDDADMKIIVAHRSPLTAILVNFARKYLGYPEGFFGYIDLSTAGLSLLSLSARRFEFVDHRGL